MILKVGSKNDKHKMKIWIYVKDLFEWKKGLGFLTCYRGRFVMMADIYKDN